KYGSTVEEILSYRDKIEEELFTIENKDEQIKRLEQERDETKQQLFVVAKKLHLLRKKVAQTLTDAIHQQLSELYMDKTRFQVKMKNFENITDMQNIIFTPNGIDEVEFYLS